jgi:oxygen-independent coproporphyrinogen III oxidase
VLDRWREAWQQYRDEGYLEFDDERVTLTRAGLLRVDGLLPAFFEPQFQGVRYT